MSSSTFVVPDGLVLRQEDGGLTIEHSGDIELHSNLGGSVRRLVSTGGDVILHAALELHTIEASGTVRSSKGLQVQSLKAGQATITGDVKANTVQLEGKLTVEGDLDVGKVRAGAISCGELAATSVTTAGLVETSGSVEVDQLEAGGVQCGGDLHVQRVKSAGEVMVIGDAHGQSIQSSGLSIGGGSEFKQVDIDGSVEVSGDIRADSIKATGALGASGALEARSVKAGSLEVGGDLRVAEALHTDGDLQIGGDVSTSELQAGNLRLGGKVDATRIVATGDLTTTGQVKAERVEADTVRVESGSLSARVVQGGTAVHLGAVQIKADIVIAPTVEIDAGARGKISVVECHNELPATRIKGCLSLEDLDDLFGNAEQFLADRGVTPLGGDRPSRSGGDGGGGSDDDLESLPPLNDDSGLSAFAQAEVGSDDFDDADEAEPVDEATAEDAEAEEADAEEADAEEADAEEAEAAADEDAAEEEAEEEDAEEEDADDPVTADEVLGLGQVADSDITLNEGEGDSESFEVEADDADQEVSEVDIDIEVDMGSDTAQVQAGQQDNGASESEDDLFGWADQMLTDVVADDAVHHPDAEPDDTHMVAEVEDVESLVSELEELVSVEPVEEVQEDPIHGQMQDTISRIVTCYVHSEMPPAVTRLKELVDARDYTRIRSDITDIWNQLLKFHQKRGMRIQPQVTTTFNTINSLVRKL